MKIMPRASRVTATCLIACLMLPQSLWAQSTAMVAHEGALDENPSMGAMVGDFFVARPIGLVMTVGGAGLWLVSLPFTLLAGNANEAADTLILGPGEQTFMRCLGCRQSGYTYKDIEQHKKRQQAAVTED
ncbi:MAG: hypothetical protein V2I26_05165 [Halieaceae bacterium]|jgi:hypothetical protein|nr:hypothetical protein [Halieaceae bacterium]